MRCIETFKIKRTAPGQPKIKSNMRCIETIELAEKNATNADKE